MSARDPGRPRDARHPTPIGGREADGRRRGAERVVALDLLRGAAVAGMILVANAGDWAHAYAPFVHADWNGWTFADTVFPAFLFAVGMALGLSFPRDLSGAAERRHFWLRVARRAVLLVLLGLLLNATYNLAVALGEPPIGPDDPPALRLPGVLQRIAFCYVLAAILIVATGRREGRVDVNPRAILLAALIVLAGYWAALRFVPVPGFGAGHLDKAGSLPAYLDRLVFGPAHMWPMGAASWRGPVLYDPEGLLASLPATANLLFGVLVAHWWRRAEGPPLARLAAAGAMLVALGLLGDALIPIDKKLWTSSFVLLTGGLSVLALVALHLAGSMPRPARLLTPLRVLGGNAVLAYVVSILVQSLAGVPLGRSASAPTAQGWADGVARAVFPNPWLASLACSLVLLALIVLLIAPLHRRAVHFRL